MTELSILATLPSEPDDLDRAQRIVKVFGMVNVATGFDKPRLSWTAAQNLGDPGRTRK